MDISKVEPLDPFEKHVFVVPKQEPVPLIKLDDELLKQAEVPYQELSLYEKARLVVNLVPFIYQYLKGRFMKDWKTTLSGVLGGVAYLLGAFGFHVPQPVLDGIIITALFFIGLFSKDAPKQTP